MPAREVAAYWIGVALLLVVQVLGFAVVWEFFLEVASALGRPRRLDIAAGLSFSKAFKAFSLLCLMGTALSSFLGKSAARWFVKALLVLILAIACRPLIESHPYRVGAFFLLASGFVLLGCAFGSPMRWRWEKRETEMPAKRKTASKWLRRSVSVAFSALVLWIAWVAITVWQFGARDRAAPADCLVVLGAAAYGANPSPVFEGRLRHAMALYHAGMASRVIFTGGYGEGATHAESEVGKAYAVMHGGSASEMLTENRSRTTRENLIEAQRLMGQEGIGTAILVSDPLHLKRASMMAQDLGMGVVPSPAQTSAYRSIRARLGFLVREVGFYHIYLLWRV